MATFVVGDVQGCYDTLLALLGLIRFDRRHDRLWFCGDLVNRGPKSLETLRFIRDLGDDATVVLGNHDLHLLAVANGSKAGKRDTLNDILTAPDRTELLDWLRHRPLMHFDPSFGVAMLHAGLPPAWTLDDALQNATEAGEVLSGPRYGEFLRQMYGNQPTTWTAGLTGTDRLRFVVNCFTRLRFCEKDGSLALEAKGAPESTPELVPWFQISNRQSKDSTFVFGHWSTLGRVEWPDHRVFGLDTGAVWGQRLTALRLEDRRLFSVPSPAYSQVD